MAKRESVLRSREVRLALAPAMAFGSLGAVATLGQATLLSHILAMALDRRLAAATAAPLAALFASVVARAFCAWRAEAAAWDAALRLGAGVRRRVLAKLEALGPAFLDRERVGELATTTLTGIDHLDEYYAQYLPLEASSVVTPALIVLVTLALDPFAGAVLLCTVPILPLLMALVGTFAAERVTRHWLALSRLGAQFLDIVQGLTTLVTFGRGPAAGAQIAAASADYQERTLAVLRVAFLSGMVLDIITGMAIGLLAVVVAIQVINGTAPLWVALLALLLAPECYRPLRELAAQRHAAMEAKTAADRIQEVLEAPTPDASVTGDDEPAAPLTVQIANVTYRYPDGEHAALRDVSLTLRPGTRTALVGRSGSGKSTLLRLVLRFQEPEEGAIVVNGKPLAGLAPASWRRQVAYVGQRPHLFAGTIAANLRLGRPDASLDDLRRAADLAGADAFIQALPHGYDTDVSEQGASLSAGEAQRLAIARAFLKDAPVLLLDEPTSALDAAHEEQIVRALDRLMVGRTVLIAAHRRQTIRAADQIAVLSAGRVIARGTHANLLARGGEYARLMDDDGLQEPFHRIVAPPDRCAESRCKIGRPDHPMPVEPTGIRMPVAKPGPDNPPSGLPAGSRPSTGGTRSVIPREAPLTRPTPTPSPRRIGGEQERAALGGSVVAVGLAVLSGFAGIGLPAVGGYLLGAAARGTPLLSLGLPITLVRLFGVGRGVVRYAERLVAHRLTFRRVTTLRCWCYERLLPLAPALLVGSGSGDVLSRLIEDVQTMEARLQRVALPLMTTLVLASAATLATTLLNAWLGVVLFIFLALAGGALPRLRFGLARTAEQAIVVEQGAIRAQLVAALQGLADLLTLDGGIAAVVQTAGLDNAKRRLARARKIHVLAGSSLTGLALVALLATALSLQQGGAVPDVAVLVVALVTPALIEAILPVGDALAFAKRSETAARRVGETLAAAPAVVEAPGPWPTPARFALAFDHVSFSYGSGGPPRLRDVTLTAPEGAQVALIGPSGAGKTTLLHLAMRFWDPAAGAIRLGDADLRAYALGDVRRSIGLISQRVHIFADTLRRNLLLACPDAGDEELLMALEGAGLDYLARPGEYGLDRWLGEHGAQLSGGERQRVAVARALLQDAPILLMDEPTAHLDPATAHDVLDRLERLAAGRATLWVTHQILPERLARLDEIIVLADGQIQERGTHRELLRRGGLYRRLVNTQRHFLSA